jgi:hypothetical protein
MKVQFNTDKTIHGDERSTVYFTGLVENGLKRFDSHISRVEVHLSDKNGTKEGVKDIRCLMEARLDGRQPIAITSQENTEEKAISQAIEKMKSSLDTIIGKIQNH